MHSFQRGLCAQSSSSLDMDYRDFQHNIIQHQVLSSVNSYSIIMNLLQHAKIILYRLLSKQIRFYVGPTTERESPRFRVERSYSRARGVLSAYCFVVSTA